MSGTVRASVGTENRITSTSLILTDRTTAATETDMNADNDNDKTGEDRSVFIVIGNVSKRKGGEKIAVHVLIKAPDDDYAVRETLNALAGEGYAEAELDQIGVLDGFPDEEPHASAMEGVLEGEVAIITFD